MDNPHAKYGWVFVIGLVALVAGTLLPNSAIENSGIYYEGGNTSIRIGIVLLVVSSLAISVSGFMLAGRIDHDNVLARSIAQGAGVVASASVIGIAWLWAMVPNMQAVEYRALPNRGVGLAEHQVIMTMEGIDSFLGVAVALIGILAIAYLLAAEFFGRLGLMAKAAGAGAVWSVLLGFSIAVHVDDVSLWLFAPAFVSAIIFSLVIGSPQPSRTSNA